jgi:hypothetical protein
MTVARRWFGALLAVACTSTITLAPTSAAELETPGSRPMAGNRSPTSIPPTSAAEVVPMPPPADDGVTVAAGPESGPTPAPNATATRRRPLPNSGPRADAMVGVGYGF